ncbi:MAG TPA: GyrI-like domain-containing protein [Terriglobia bacterium]|nr:GyrI-like domain-containing protein [Terriglobia bacterium]
MPSTEKLDLYKVHKAEYVAPRKPVLVKTRPAQYLTIRGQGKPAETEFHNAIGVLYGMAFTIKMARKFAGKDYKVCHLEGLYWSGEDENVGCFDPNQQGWNWLLIIRVPDFIKEKDLKQAVSQLRARGKAGDFEKVKLQKINEGECVQILHVGPYSQENKTIDQMLAFAREKGLSCHGKHHEIYLSDPRRVAPERLRTILRFPVA